MLILFKHLCPQAIPVSMLGFAILLCAGGASAQGRALEELRSRVLPGPQQMIPVAKGCLALSSVPSESTGYVTLWDGPCVEGYAHGEGIRRLYAVGELLSISKVLHDRGRWIRTDESYSLTLGRIVTRYTDPKTGMNVEKAVDPAQVPTWGRELVATLPSAQKAWAEEVVRRQAEARRISGRPPKDEDDEENREMLFGPTEGEAEHNN